MNDHPFDDHRYAEFLRSGDVSGLKHLYPDEEFPGWGCVADLAPNTPEEEAALDRTDQYTWNKLFGHQAHRMANYTVQEDLKDAVAAAQGTLSPQEAAKNRSVRAVHLAQRICFTRPEIEAAQEVQVVHESHYPEDKGKCLTYAFPFRIQDLEEREAESKALHLSDEEHQKRELLLISLRLPLEIQNENTPEGAAWCAAAQERVNAWLSHHPQDTRLQGRSYCLKRDTRWIAEALAKSAKEATAL